MGIFGGTIGPAPAAVSTFEVLLDDPITLETGGDIDRTFTFEAQDSALVGEDIPTIVSFFLIRADDLRLQVSMNNASIIREFRPGPPGPFTALCLTPLDLGPTN